MHQHRHFFSAATILLLALVISACSSGSSNDPEASASTNTVPTDDPIAGESATGESNTEESTSGESGGEPMSNEGTADTESEDISEDDPDANGDADQQSGQEDMDTDEEGATQPNIDPNSAFGQFQNRIQLLTGRTLIALNRKLNQGELLSDQENNCLGTYDPALGEPLLAIDCEQPLATGNVPIFMGVAAFEDTSNCQSSLQNETADECVVDRATLQINTLFVTQDTGTPQPEVGASVTYNIEQGLLTINNLPDALSGIFACQFDITTGLPSGEQVGDCDAQLVDLANLIDLHLLSGT